MELEYLQKKYNKLLGLISKTRKAQIDYYKYKGSNYLDKARRLERELDQLIIKENKELLSKQNTLFNGTEIQTRH